MENELELKRKWLLEVEEATYELESVIQVVCKSIIDNVVGDSSDENERTNIAMALHAASKLATSLANKVSEH